MDNSRKMKNGIVYIAFKGSNKAILHELRNSAEGAKQMHPHIPITLFTNEDPGIKAIDEVKLIKVSSERMKQDVLPLSPYDNTLYLDTDTNVCGPIEELFDLMGRFDLAAVPDVMRKNPRHTEMYPDYKSISEGFPEFGGGVLLFRKCKEVDLFFATWQRNFDKWYELTNEVRDQPSLRVSIWQCDGLKFYSLPEEYNHRTKKYDNIRTRILHQHNLWRK
jgi:hypothetical protein